jgi:Tfp pilus assembly protein PilN
MLNTHRTLLLLTNRLLARIDLVGGRKPRIQQVWQQTVSGDASLLDGLQAACQLGPKRLGSVWVVCSEFWTNIVTLPEDATGLLCAEECEQALALEAELDSGLSAFTSQLVAQRLETESGANPSWCVMQIAHDEIHSIERLLRQRRAKLAGLAHPAAAAISSTAHLSSQHCRSLLVGLPSELSQAVESNDGRLIEEALKHWARHWTGCIVAKPTSPLVLVPESAAPAMSHHNIAALMIGAGALLSCGAWFLYTRQRINEVDRQIVQLEQLQRELDQWDEQRQTLVSRATRLRQDIDTTRSQQQTLSRELQLAERIHAQTSELWLALVDALALSVDNECWLQRWESQPLQATLRGIALDTAAAHRFASVLEVNLRGSGWIAMPCETNPTEHDWVEFKIVLRAHALDPATHSEESATTGIAFTRVRGQP